MGAGVDSLFQDPALPRHVPILRVIDPLMSERMATWCLWSVINIQRKGDEYFYAQQQSRWDKGIENYRNTDNSELRVGIMGLGVMGGAVAETLLKLKYPVYAWTRTNAKRFEERTHTLHESKTITEHYYGNGQLLEFASRCDIIICLLPLTPSTQGILDRKLFDAMPAGSSIINAARGKHLVESDLIDALDSGQLSNAILDVFREEPLPKESVLWKHNKVRIFPHVSSMTNIETSVEQMMESRRMILQEGTLPRKELVVDWQAGY